jgi:nitrous oxide reductase accessory protein NosL
MKDKESSVQKRRMYLSIFILSFILQTSMAVMLIVGCQQSQVAPPALIADKAACQKCNMLISETNFASAFIDAEGKMQIDDIGCMLGVLRSYPKQPEHIWVRDYKQDTWISATDAFFISSPQLGTPMNYGFVALESANDVQELVHAKGGTVINGFDTLLKEFREMS